MTNLLTVLTTTMEYKDLAIMAGIGLIPVLFAILFSKRYNVLHGLVTFFFVTYVLFFAIQELSSFSFFTKIISSEMNEGLTILFGIPRELICAGLAKISFVSKLVEMKFAKYIVTGVVVVAFIVCQLVASAIRRRREY